MKDHISNSVLVLARSSIVVLFLLLLTAPGATFIPIGPVDGAANGQGTLGEIHGAVTYESKDIECTRDIHIGPGSSLTLTKSTLTFHPNGTKPFYFVNVSKGGSLVIEGSTLTTSVGYLAFMILCEGNLTITGSTISQMTSYEFDSDYVGGIIITSDGAKIEDTQIFNSNVGISFLGCNDTVLTDNTINSTYVSIFSKGSSVKIDKNTMSESIYGIYDLGSNNDYSGNEIQNVGEAIHLEGSSSAVHDNDIHDNDYGIYCYRSDNVSISNNRFTNDNTGIHSLDGSVIIDQNTFNGGKDAVSLLSTTANVTNNEISDQRLFVTESVDCSGCTKPEIVGNGAGILLLHSEARVEHNVIRGCSVGVCSEYSTGSVLDNIIENMTSSGSSDFCSFINKDLISADPMAQMAGTGVIMLGQTTEQPVLMSNHITDNDNDGIFLSDASVVIKDNVISGNGGYGIHTLDCDVTAALNNTLINNEEGYAHSIYVSFRTMDIYGDIQPYADVEIHDGSGDLIYSGDTQNLGSLSLIFLSYTSNAPVASSAVTTVKQYNISFAKGGAVKYLPFIALPDQQRSLSVEIPMLRSDLGVSRIAIDKEVIVGDEVEIKATVKNTGDTKATNVTVLFIWESDGESRVIAKKTIAEINAGQSKSMSVLWSPQTTAEYSITVELDPENDVKEISDGNNERTVKTTVISNTHLWVTLSLQFFFLLLIFLIVYVTTNKKF